MINLQNDSTMKTSFKMSVCSLALFVVMPAAMAHTTEKKQIRNDHVSVSKGIQQYDINPFVDSKRVVRNDHVRYSNPKVETDTEVMQKHRFVRNDHVIVSK